MCFYFDIGFPLMVKYYPTLCDHIMNDGRCGKVLRVNLSLRKVTFESLKDDDVLNFMGGGGLAAKYLYDEVPAWVGPFDPQNRLIFSAGPVTGTEAPSAGRHTVVTKSPLTGLFGDANSGGFWGAELKFAGFDMIIIQGRSKTPVFLWINDGQTQIRDASSYWGMDARVADQSIRNDLGDQSIKVSTIGQAGENQVRYAGIMNDNAERTAARCGVGAVMGFMNLKAIAVRGYNHPTVARPEELRKLARNVLNHMKNAQDVAFLRKGGTPRNFGWSWFMGDIPSSNWRSTDFPSSDKVDDLLGYPGGYEKILVGNRSCYLCPMGCRRVTTVKGKYATQSRVEGPEYETLAVFGPNCCISDVEAIGKMNDLCNLYGLDTLSTGGTIAFAMECYEKGIISKQDTGGIDLKFGDPDVVIDLIHKIAIREGIGGILAEGSRRASQIFGGNSKDFAIQVKGLELPMHDPRIFEGGGVHYACTITGGRHTDGISLEVEIPNSKGLPELDIPGGLDKPNVDGKGRASKIIEDWEQVFQSMGFCWFAEMARETLNTRYISFENVLKTFAAVTNKDLSIKDALLIGERIFNIKKAFNVRHGATREDDCLPERITNVKGRGGRVVNLERYLEEYYSTRGWNPINSKPTKEKLVELDLQNISNDIYG